MRASAVLIKLHPLALWSDEQWIIDAADVSVFPLDRCRIHWLAECPVVAISVCLAARLALYAVASDVVACAHYRMPLSGLIGCFSLTICWR